MCGLCNLFSGGRRSGCESDAFLGYNVSRREPEMHVYYGNEDSACPRRRSCGYAECICPYSRRSCSRCRESYNCK